MIHDFEHHLFYAYWETIIGHIVFNMEFLPSCYLGIFLELAPKGQRNVKKRPRSAFLCNAQVVHGLHVTLNALHLQKQGIEIYWEGVKFSKLLTYYYSFHETFEEMLKE